MQQQRKILVAPMNWGLGHASRDIPIIHALLNRNFTVIIAADGRPLELLRKEFPLLNWIRLPGYDIRYHIKRSAAIQLIVHIPHIIKSFFSEHNRLKKIINEEGIDAVISDNRYGLYSEKIHSIFITHQTGIIVPKILKWIEPIINWFNRLLIEKFDECWIPDLNGEINLSGDLSHKYRAPGNSHFIGILSALSYREIKIKYDLLVVLSGPEPQRTALEKIIKEQVMHFSNQPLNFEFKFLMVQGISEGSDEIRMIRKNFHAVDFLSSKELNNAMLSAALILCRPGYSSIMNLAVTGKKAILIPTPGQTEQEYLAEYFMNKKIFYSEHQDEFNLERAFHQCKKYSGIHVAINPALLQIRIKKLFEANSFE